MKKFFKKNWFKIGILFCLAALCGIYYFNTKSSQISTVSIKKEFSFQNEYSLKFWESLSVGDVSSTECQKAVEKYSENESHFRYNFYSYEKKRCFGFNEYINNNGGIRIEEVFIDVVTGAELVSCAYTSIDKKETINCKDSKNNWYWNSGDPLPYPEPYPIYINVWKPLKEASAR